MFLSISQRLLQLSRDDASILQELLQELARNFQDSFQDSLLQDASSNWKCFCFSK